MRTRGRAAARRGNKPSKPKSTAELVLEDGVTIIDQLVRHNISLHAFPQPFTDRLKAFRLDLDIYPDEDGSAYIRKRSYLAVNADNAEIRLDLDELEAFAAGVGELAKIARERGFISGEQRSEVK